VTLRRSASPREPLYLTRHSKPFIVRLSRWASYPHFIATLEEYGPLPELVTVTWGPYRDFVKYEPDDAGDGFIEEVAARMKAGEDIPPLIREQGKPSDGIHRAFAAKSLGMRVVPVVELVRERL
jgi:hypothetical protein